MTLLKACMTHNNYSCLHGNRNIYVLLVSATAGAIVALPNIHGGHLQLIPVNKNILGLLIS